MILLEINLSQMSNVYHILVVMLLMLHLYQTNFACITDVHPKQLVKCPFFANSTSMQGLTCLGTGV